MSQSTNNWKTFPALGVTSEHRQTTRSKHMSKLCMRKSETLCVIRSGVDMPLVLPKNWEYTSGKSTGSAIDHGSSAISGRCQDYSIKTHVNARKNPRHFVRLGCMRLRLWYCQRTENTKGVKHKISNLWLIWCDFRASSDYRIKTHLNFVHETIWEFECNQVGCGYAFGPAKELRIHIWKKNSQLAHKLTRRSRTLCQARLLDVFNPFFFLSCWPTRGLIWRSTGISKLAWHRLDLTDFLSHLSYQSRKKW